MRILLFTDTLADVNGVSRFIRNIADEALALGRDLHVVTSTRFDVPIRPNLLNFKPLAARAMPGYPNLELALPPPLRMLRLVRGFKPSVIHISTPGPIGCVGWLAARLTGTPLVGVYHTDFPAYIERLFDDPALTWACGKFMGTFYKPFRAVFTRSKEYATSVERLGVPRRAIVPLRPGIRIQDFHPRFRSSDTWTEHGGSERTLRVLSVGRISVEKNLPMLVRVWSRVDRLLRQQGERAELVVVGDGPYRLKMEQLLAGTRVRFLGFRHGEELSRLYASSDLFAFPSVTDTLGQVVMEAQASGLPVIVSDAGGPKEVVRDGVTGLVLPSGDVEAWVSSIVTLVKDSARRRAMGSAAAASMATFTIRATFEHFWSVHESASARKDTATRGQTRGMSL